MAKKIKTRFVCTACGCMAPRWSGQCNDCKAWNTLEEQLVQTGKNKGLPVLDQNQTIELMRLQDIQYSESDRIKTGLSELDRTLGGGIVPGSLILLGGEPGIGKSTLLLQSAVHQAEEKGHKVIYVSGEESAQQIKSRATRLGIEETENFFLLAQTDIAAIVELLAKEQPIVAILDSIQAVYDSRLDSAPGTISQVKNTCNLLLKLAKQNQIATWIIGHVNKDGDIAGPKVLEHMVDSVLYFEGERYKSFRILRTIKNRFGATHEVGVFDMQAKGLVPVDNPSALFLAESESQSSGSAIVCTLEGTCDPRTPPLGLNLRARGPWTVKYGSIWSIRCPDTP